MRPSPSHEPLLDIWTATHCSAHQQGGHRTAQLGWERDLELRCACVIRVTAPSVTRELVRALWRMLGYETMTRRSMYTGDMRPLFSLNSPNLTACGPAKQLGGRIRASAVWWHLNSRRRAAAAWRANTSADTQRESGVHTVLLNRDRLRANLNLVQLQHQVLEILLLHWPALPCSDITHVRPPSKHVFLQLRVLSGPWRFVARAATDPPSHRVVETDHSSLPHAYCAAVHNRRSLRCGSSALRGRER